MRTWPVLAVCSLALSTILLTLVSLRTASLAGTARQHSEKAPSPHFFQVIFYSFSFVAQSVL